MTAPCTFVTGASGFVGRHLCAHLRAKGHRVRGLVRRDDPALAALGVELVRGELAEPARWQSAIADADYLIHCAANARFAGRADYDAANVAGTRHVLDAARTAAPGLRRFVYVSSIGAVDRARGDACRTPLDDASPPNPSSAYGRSKLAGEKLVRTSGLRFSIVRPAMVVGADMRYDSHLAVFARSALRRSPLAWFAWPGAVGVVHVDDLAAALELCATHPEAEGRTFFCAGPAMTLRACFTAAESDATRLPLDWTVPLARAAAWCLPFRLKAVLLPALVASDQPLEQLGWRAPRSGADAATEVANRERARCHPELDPGGQTVITGAASGLGRALVARLAPVRRHLLLVDRDAAGLERVRAAHPHCQIQALDLSEESAVHTLLASADWRAAPVTELFLCAGFGLRGAMLDHDAAQHARLFKVNVLARLALAHAALPAMQRAHFGRVVFVSSSSAFQPLPAMASYAASNAALLSLGEAWAAEVAGDGVHLMTVCPGGMQTNFQRVAGVKTNAREKLMAPEDVADAILRGLARSKTTLIVSARAHAMAWLARMLPRRVSVALWQRLMNRLR